MAVNLNGVDDRLLIYFKQAKEIYEKDNPEYTVIISEGIRSNQRQKNLYKKGRKLINGKWVIVDKKNVVTYTLKSKHIVGKAIDIAFIKNKKCDWSIELFKAFAEIIDKIDVTCIITWGGSWKRFKDYPHFQVD